MIDVKQSVIIILTAAAVTAFLRFLPFIAFSKKVPAVVTYLGNVLPFAIIGMLLVYCLKGTDFTKSPFGLSEILSILLVAVLHKWKHSTILSITSGVVFYMLCVQWIFA